MARWIETLAEFDYTVEHRPGRLHSNADGLPRPFCKQCYDRPSHIPWVQEMESADAAVGPWSGHLLEIAPELTDADVAKLQDDDEVLGPVKSMLSQGYSPTLIIYAPCPWKAENFHLCGRPLSCRIRFWSDGMAMPSSWWCHSLYAASSSPHTHTGSLVAHLGSQRMLAQLRRLYYWPGMRKDIDAWGEGCAISRGRQVDLMATFARSPPVHQLTLSPSTSCLAYLPQRMATNTSLSPLTTSRNGLRQYPCATQRHQRACVHFIAPYLAASACLASYIATREQL